MKKDDPPPKREYRAPMDCSSMRPISTNRKNRHHCHNNNNHLCRETTTTTTGTETFAQNFKATSPDHPPRSYHPTTIFSNVLSHPLALPLTTLLHHHHPESSVLLPLEYQVYPSDLLYKVLYEDYDDVDEEEDDDSYDHDSSIRGTCRSGHRTNDGRTAAAVTTTNRLSVSLSTIVIHHPLDNLLESAMKSVFVRGHHGPNTTSDTFGGPTSSRNHHHRHHPHPEWMTRLVQLLQQYCSDIHHPLRVVPLQSPTVTENRNETIHQRHHSCPFHILLVDPSSPSSSTTTTSKTKDQPLSSVVTAIQIGTTATTTTTTRTTTSPEEATYHGSSNYHPYHNHHHWSKTFETGMTFLDSVANHSSSSSSSQQQQQQQQQQNLCYQKPMLFVNMTIDTEPHPHPTHPEEKSSITTIRMGCCLCTRRPKSTPDKNNVTSPIHVGDTNHTTNVVLLWRDEYTILEDNNNQNSENNAIAIQRLSKAFGNMIRASTLCYYYRDLSPYVPQKYLSPNCSLYDNRMVLRCYDSRMYQQELERRSDIYLLPLRTDTTNSCIFPSEPCADVVVSLSDSDVHIDGTQLAKIKLNGTLDQSIRSDRDDTVNTASNNDSPMDWLWQFRGTLIVIATPYRPGYHYAKRPTDFVPVIEHLQYLHDVQHIVHGDIRASNMVFGTKKCHRPKKKEANMSRFITDTDRAKNRTVSNSRLKLTTARTQVLNTMISTIKTSAVTAIKEVLSTRPLFRRPMASVELPTICLPTLSTDNKDNFDATKGCLIDFDFGGKHGASTTKYPTGYNKIVGDGYRIGQEHHMIQYKDDWYALVMVIFQVHEFAQPAKKTEKDDVNNTLLYNNIHQTILKRVENIVLHFCCANTDGKGNTDSEKVPSKDISKLKRLLVDMEATGYSVNPRLA